MTILLILAAASIVVVALLAWFLYSPHIAKADPLDSEPEYQKRGTPSDGSPGVEHD